MASLLSKRMPFWSLEINGKDITRELGAAVSGMDVEYTLNQPVQSTVNVSSMSFLEDFFTPPGRLTIKMGWAPTQLVTMVKEAEIVLNPEGSAREFLEYTVTATYPAKLMKQEKSRVFPNRKAQVVAIIAGENGLIPNIQIADNTAIPPMELPMQNMQNDMQFLIRCAQKWNCLMWVDNETKTLYFVDANQAHDFGARIKKPNIEDLEPEYILGYRSDRIRNNVADIRWSFGSAKGNKPGEAGVQGLSENGMMSVREQNYNLEYDGVYYKVKPEIMAQLKTNPSLGLKITALMQQSGVQRAQSDLKKYFDPLNSSKTNSPDSPSTSDATGAGADIQVELNVGDPYLRPPRKSVLYAGSNSPRARNSDLPGFLLNSQAKPGTQKFNIYKVKTGISNGMMRTSMGVRR